ncbi:MAG: YeeE/YedE thiosulfate transporter family protein [Halioglobus sp.]
MRTVIMSDYLIPLAGGLLIGLSAAALLFTQGRIAGIAGILYGAISGQADSLWRWLFLAGLLLGPVLYHSVSGLPLPIPSDLSVVHAIAGGLLVGIGTRIGSGCTSGHGVCGLGRRSVRSLAATCTFMATGVVTVFVIRHVMGGA